MDEQAEKEVVYYEYIQVRYSGTREHEESRESSSLSVGTGTSDGSTARVHEETSHREDHSQTIPVCLIFDLWSLLFHVEVHTKCESEHLLSVYSSSHNNLHEHTHQFGKGKRKRFSIFSKSAVQSPCKFIWPDERDVIVSPQVMEAIEKLCRNEDSRK